MTEFKEGETYWFKNPMAGRNLQSCGVLIEKRKDGTFLMENKHYGKVIVTAENLRSHN